MTDWSNSDDPTRVVPDPSSASSTPERADVSEEASGSVAGTAGGSTDDPSHPVGRLLARRFRIVGLLGRGGMGEVYAADDVELQERVAIKVVRPEMARDPSAVARFRREVQLARQITHPSVCRIYDLFHHRQPGGGRDLILSMELLDGETLARRLERDGAMAPEVAGRLALQIASALASAHRCEVVHRDLKAQNVMIVRSREGTERAVLTDFGLARSLDHLDRNLTGRGDLVGSFKTMAPEQLEGEPVTPSTDVYAFGLLLFRMLTGRRVFEGTGGDALTMAYRRLHETPPPVSESAPVSPAVDALILRCLSRTPADRPPDGAALEREIAEVFGLAEASGTLRVDAVHSDEDRPPRSDAGQSAGSRRLLGWAVAGLGLSALLAGLVAIAPWQNEEATAPGGPEIETEIEAEAETAKPEGLAAPETANGVAARPAVAVVSVARLAGGDETSWLEVALPEMLSAEIAAASSLRVLPQEQVAQMRRELALDDPEGGASLDGDRRRRIRRYLGADALVWGSATSIGSGADAQLRLDLKAELPTDREIEPASETASDPASDPEVVFVSAEGREAELFAIVRRAGDALRDAFGAADLDAAERRALAAAMPDDRDVAATYAQGLEALRRGDAPRARDALLDVVAEDEDLAVAHAALADAWRLLGRDDRALASAERALEAFAARGDASREQALEAEGLVRRLEPDWPEAEAIFASLFRLRPDDLEVGLRLAEVQVDGGRGEAALETVEALRRLPSGDDPRVDLAAARAQGALSRYAQQLESAHATIEAAQAIGSRHLEARGLEERSRALSQLGHWDEAVASVRAARDLYDDLDWRRGVAATLTDLGVLWWRRDALDRATEAFSEAAEIASSLGDRRTAIRARGNAAMVLDTRGDREEARAMYERVLVDARALDDAKSESALQINLGIIELADGDLDTARRRFEKALELKRSISDRAGVSRVYGYLGRIALLQGRGTEALEHHDEAIRIARSIGDPRGEAFALQYATQARLVLDSPRVAEQSAQRALAAARRLESPSIVLGAQQILAEALLSLDRFDDVETLVREMETMASSLDASELGLVHALEAQMLLDRPSADRESAVRALDLARRALDQVEEPMERADVWATTARAHRALGQDDEANDAADRLETTLREVGEALRVSHAAAELAALRGRASDLDRLEAEALDRGETPLALFAAFKAARLREDRDALEALAERTRESGFPGLARRARDAASGAAGRVAKDATGDHGDGSPAGGTP